MGRLLLGSLLVLAVSFCAQALTGSGESGTIALETVSPSLDAVSVVTERSLSATFSEPMLAPGVTTESRYTATGLGAGTLTTTPGGVSGAGPYTISWTTGEMRSGEPITVTATGIQDLVGNPLDPAHTSASSTGLGVAPVFSDLAVNPAQASTGKKVTITFRASESLDGDPAVTVNGHAATWVSGGKAVDFTFEYVVQADEPVGAAAISVTGFDLAGNPGALNGNTALEITDGPAVPLYAWPAGLALLATGAILLARKKRGWIQAKGIGSASLSANLFLLIAALLASSGALAAAPSISDVTVQQIPSGGTTRVEISYELTAPNGPCDITAWLSKDGGADGYSWPVTAVTGDLTNVTSGAGHLILWDIRADYPEEAIPDARIRLVADDGIVQHTLTYTAETNGSIAGDSPQTINHGTDGAAVTAAPNTGFHFVQWSDGSTQNPRTDTNVTADITVTASFAVNTYTITCGVVGDGSCTANPSTVSYGSTSTIMAAPATGRHLVQIMDSVDGAWPGELGVSRITSPVTADRTVTAVFAINTYTLTYTAGANGSISGGSPQPVNHGDSGTAVTATPNAGYYFTKWSDGVLTATRQDTNVTANLSVTATFVSVNVSSIAINSGAATTTSKEVTLNNTCVGSPTQYMASESPTFDGASWTAYGTAPSFTMSPGTGGVKTVYFKVRNAEGESTTVSDTINFTEQTILLPGNVPLVLCWVSSGSYQMGRYSGEVDSSSSEDPKHLVTLAYGFWMGKYEVTQQQWLAVQGSWPGAAPSASYGLGNTYPAYYISWDDAKNFITTLNTYIVNSVQGPLTVRLPSEAEWEYACRAGTQTRFYWGDDLGYTQVGNYAWYTGNNIPSGTKPVGGKIANALGLYDMNGNVCEFCEDDYHGYAWAPTDGSAKIETPRSATRMMRGGGWRDIAMGCRSAFRSYFDTSSRDNYIGFRLVAVQ